MKRKTSKHPDVYAGYIEHPRYGRGPRITGLDPSDMEYSADVFLHWHSPKGVRIPNTAIAANTDKQAPATIHVTHYFDAKRVCRKCGAHFIFFAEEQRYWYEDLGFPLEADLVDCIDCRRHEHRLRERRQEYEHLLKKEDRDSEETLRMVENGVFLVEEKIFSSKLLPRLRGFLNSLADDRPSALLDRIAALEESSS